MVMSLVFMMWTSGLKAQTSTLPGVSKLAERAIIKSRQIQIRQEQVEKVRLDKLRAYDAYLPKVTLEANYTRLNDDLRFPSEFQDLLSSTERLLIKEQTAMAMAGMPIPENSKVNFGTAYTDPNLSAAVAKNFKPISPIQDQEFFRASLNAQMVLFSGMKVPYTIKAAEHQQAAMQLMVENEQVSVISQTVLAYDKLAILYQSQEVLNTTERYLLEQKKYVDKAFANGLVIDLNRQKLELALKQLEVKQIENASNLRILCSRIEELTGFPADSASLLRPGLQPWYLAEMKANSASRPDVMALNEAIIATDYKRKADWTEYTPKLVAFGKRELNESALTMLDPAWYVGLGVRWTLFDGLTAQKNAAQARVEMSMLENKRLDAIALSDLNFVRIRYDIEKNLKIITSAREQVKIADEIVTMSEKQFRQGLVTMTDHLISVNDYEKARLDYIVSVFQERASVLEYLTAAGKLEISNIQ